MKTLAAFFLICCFLPMAWAQTTPQNTASQTATNPNANGTAVTTTTSSATNGTNPVTTTVITTPAKPAPLKIIRVDRIRKFNPSYWGDSLRKQRTTLGSSLFPGNYVMVDIHPPLHAIAATPLG